MTRDDLRAAIAAAAPLSNPPSERDIAADLHRARIGCREHGPSADDAATVHRAQVRRIASAHPEPLDEERALDWAIRLAAIHLMSHDTDEHNLSLAIELMKTMRDEPARIGAMFERWELDPDEPRDERIALAARLAEGTSK